MHTVYKIVYWAVFVFLIGIAGLLVVSLFPIKDNFQIKIVQSGSMEPSIHTGSIVVIRPAEQYAVGDVITFGKDTRTVSPTTHRIVESSVTEGVMVFRTKGDANKSEDLNEVPQSTIIGKVIFSVPYLGYIIDFAKKPLGFAALIGIPALIVVYDEIGKIIEEVKKIRVKKKTEDGHIPEADQ